METSLNDVRMPRRTRGSASVHCWSAWHMMAVFSVRWNFVLLSLMPAKVNYESAWANHSAGRSVQNGGRWSGSCSVRLCIRTSFKEVSMAGSHTLSLKPGSRKKR
jgi:hypothetical protein